MSSRYEFEKLSNGAGYKFITSSGDIYIAYFTEFVLLAPTGNDLVVLSFGFTCKRSDNKKHQHYDIKVKQTIIFIIKEFFEEQNENAILYICINNDEKARNRQITFNSWFNEFNVDLEKHNSHESLGSLGFYSSILFKRNNPNKQNLIAAFYFTLEYWGLNSA